MEVKMKIESITYPTDISKCNRYNDNIDVFVKLGNGKEYCVTVATIEWIRNDMKDGCHPAGTPEIIVSELSEEIIERAVADFCSDDAFWLRAFSISCGEKIPD